MTFKTIIFAAICSGVSLSALAQDTPQAPAVVQQYENWAQFSPQVRAALLFIMAAGFDSMAATEEQGLEADSAEAHRVFLEKVLKLDITFMSGYDYIYFSTMLSINRERLNALNALPETATPEQVDQVQKLRTQELNTIKQHFGYTQVDAIIMQQLPVLQQKYLAECTAAAASSHRSVFRHFAEKLREESIMQH